MRNYNVGDKFVIEIEEICGCTERNVCAEPHTLYRAKGFNTLVFEELGLDKLERLDGDYVNENFGELQNEAYETGKNDGREEALKWQKGNEEDFYNQGLNDAWELAKKILYGIDRQLVEIFDVNVEPVFFDLTHKRAIINDHTPQEALAKIKAYEKEQAEIKVGDVVKVKNGFPFIVTHISKGTHLFGITEKGDTYTAVHISKCEKTGKHVDLSGIFAEIGKE